MESLPHDLHLSRILLVDDDELSLELLTLLLTGQGYTVTSAESGDEALQLLPQVSPKIVLTDLQMPGLSGSELALKIKAIAPHATLLAMSGSQPPQETLQGYDSFLLKPFSMEQLAQACAKKNAASSQSESVNDAPATDILDQSIYRKLAASMKAAQLEQLYQLCLSDAGQRIGTMRTFADLGDDENYRKAAHAIKGSCGMVGAVQLQRLASMMERHGLTTANHVASLDEFLLACEQLRRILIAP